MYVYIYQSLSKPKNLCVVNIHKPPRYVQCECNDPSKEPATYPQAKSPQEIMGVSWDFIVIS